MKTSRWGIVVIGVVAVAVLAGCDSSAAKKGDGGNSDAAASSGGWTGRASGGAGGNAGGVGAGSGGTGTGGGVGGNAGRGGTGSDGAAGSAGGSGNITCGGDTCNGAESFCYDQVAGSPLEMLSLEAFPPGRCKQLPAECVATPTCACVCPPGPSGFGCVLSGGISGCQCSETDGLRVTCYLI